MDMVLIFSLSTLTLLVLIGGVVLMATGKRTNTKHSNKLMILRVVLQTTTIALIVALIFLNK